MISIPKIQVKEASRVYGDFLEKTAFNLNVDPAAVLGSLAGGYAANSVYNKKKDEHYQNMADQQKIENNSYAQIENIMRDLKIIFTPINVVYNVNGQVFEIIKKEEMTPHMIQAFLSKDAEYFKNLLLNKISMEIQYAEQAFAQRLLASGGVGQSKEASFSSKVEYLTKVAEDRFDGMMKTASQGLPDAGLTLKVSFDDLRPFESSTLFTDGTLKKVASFGFLGGNDGATDLSLNRLHSEVNVGFLPDRVVYLWNGQMIEQMSLLNMNTEGYEAFRKKDKQFFIDFFKEKTKEISQEFAASPEPQEPESHEKKAAEEEPPKHAETPAEPDDEDDEDDEDEDDEDDQEDEDGEEKEAASLEEVIDDLVEEEFPVIERETIDPFRDSDVHPVAYDSILREKYGVRWARHEMESILKQIEVDFKVDEINQTVLNKLSILHAVSVPEHAMYLSPLTFEKFLRGVNSKSILFDEFQGNLSFEEIIFGLEVAKAYDGEEVFFQFHENIAPYVAEELMKDNVRFVSSQVFDEGNPSEKSFFGSVNGYLMRKWKERDAQGILDDASVDQYHMAAMQIVEISDDILKGFAEFLEVDDPYTSAESIVKENGLLSPVDEDLRTGVLNMVKENVAAHLITAMFVEYKHHELEYTLSKLQEAGVMNG